MRIEADGYIKISVKFSARCIDCSGFIEVGEEALWKKGTGIKHVDPEHCKLEDDANASADDYPDFFHSDFGDQ